MTSPNPTTAARPTDSQTVRRSRGTVIAAATFAGLGVAGAATAITMFIAAPASAHHAPTTTHAAVVPVVHHTTVTPAVPVRPAVPVTPAYDASVAAVQRELGQLNYYEGPINGVMTTQTQQAITYLQRSAHLPQTGELDSATVNALINQLVNGSSQMGS